MAVNVLTQHNQIPALQ